MLCVTAKNKWQLMSDFIWSTLPLVLLFSKERSVREPNYRGNNDGIDDLPICIDSKRKVRQDVLKRHNECIKSTKINSVSW